LKYVLGVDEAHRGNLIGSVFAGAVLLPYGEYVAGVTDSKKMKEKARIEALPRIIEQATSVGYSFATAGEIDRMNIRLAVHMAMMRAINRLCRSSLKKPIPKGSTIEVVIDGSDPFLKLDVQTLFYALEYTTMKHALESIDPKFTIRTMVKADVEVPAVSAASVVAKVNADETLCQHPQAELFEFSKNKGYATKRLVELIHEHGKPKDYRESFNLPSIKR